MEDASKLIKQSTRVTEEQSPTTTLRKRRKVKRKKKEDDYFLLESSDIPGIKRIIISPLVQRIIGCAIGTDVTAENPWKYVPKEEFEDNFELHEGSSEFLPIKNELLSYPNQELLLGYIPQGSTEFDEFYICLTEEAERIVSEIIARIKKTQEERLYNSILKSVKPWETLGSEREVDLTLIRNNRPLLEVEVESEFPVMSAKRQFRLRLVQNAKDGYAELLAGRATYSNVYKRRVDASIQVTPTITSNEAQTVCTYPKSVWTQYDFEFEPIANLSKEFTENMRSFIANQMDKLDDMINVNSAINFYTNDYLSLVKDEQYTRAPEISAIKEYKALIEEKLCKGKQIASLSWHPMWTGTVAVAYSEEVPSCYTKQKPENDVVLAAVYDVTPVLLWSFKDTLNPRLYLETPREVTVIAFCPHDENILVGGCTNGQVIVWDIKNKLKGVEEEEILTTAQQKYRKMMASLMKWMKNTKNLKLVRCTAVSELEYSHKSPVTTIQWLSPFREVSKSGQSREISERDNRISIQFMTSSRDGSILIWDLLATPVMNTSFYKPQRRTRRLKKRPSALTFDVSPFKALHRVLKPHFRINIVDPKTNRPLPISSFTVKKTVQGYIEVNPDPNRKFNVTDRIIYKPAFNRPTHALISRLTAGTTEGDFIIASWEGFEFNTGEVVNKESAIIENFAKYHDGPIVSLSRSVVAPDLCLTVGGKVFALWKDELKGKPVFWRRCKRRYTHGMWNNYRPSMFRLTRADGCIEIWHLKIRSDCYRELIFVSGKGLTGLFTHPQPMKQNVIGIADGNGSLRLHFLARNLAEEKDGDKYSTARMCGREAIRKISLMKWQEEWLNKNEDWLNEKKKQELLVLQEKEKRILQEKLQLEEERLQLEQEAADLNAMTKPEPGRYAEWGRQQWIIREKERMNNVLLSNKALDINYLEKQQLPLKKIAAQEKKKKRKQEERLNNASKMFDDTVAMYFPDAIEKKPPPPLDPYGGGDPVDVKLRHFLNYKQIEENREEYVKNHPYTHHFNWLKMLQRGKARRDMLDRLYGTNLHRQRISEKRAERRLSQQKTSTTSINDEILSDESLSNDTSVDPDESLST